MKNIVNSLLCLRKCLRCLLYVNDRNVDGSNKHLIKYCTRLFYIGHLTITISIFTSYSAANIRALFPFRRNGSIHSLSSEQTISRRKVCCCTTSREFPWLPHESRCGWRRRLRSSLRFILFPGSSISSFFSSRRCDAAFSPLRRSISLPSLVPALSSNYENRHGPPVLGNTVTSGWYREKGMVNVRKMIRNFLSKTRRWNSAFSLSIIDLIIWILTDSATHRIDRIIDTCQKVTTMWKRLFISYEIRK